MTEIGAIDPGDQFTITRPMGVSFLALLNGVPALVMLPMLLIAGVFILSEADLLALLLLLVLLVGQVLSLVCAYGLWTLKPFGRTLQIVLAVIGLLGFPVGTIISLMILYFMWRPGIKLIFSGRDVASFSQSERGEIQRTQSGGGVLIVIIIVIVMATCFAGLIAAIAIPNFLNAVDRGRQKRTMADIQSLATSVEAYAVDHDEYPVFGSLDELRELVEPTYIIKAPSVDGWGYSFFCEGDADGYLIRSPGKDGVLDVADPRSYRGGRSGDFNADIVLENGEFLQWPQGLQH